MMKLGRNLFRRLFVPAILIFWVLLSPNTLIAQCDECIGDIITLYDATVDVSEPPSSDTIAYAKWLSLFNLGTFARTISQEEDPTKDCLQWVDMGTWLSGTPANSSCYGVENITPAPAGPIKSTCYLMRGSVTTLVTDSLYLFTWRVECGTSREVVAGASSVYATTSGLTGAVAAARQAVQGVQPLHQTIQDFEIDKRTQDVTVARYARSHIVMTPEKTNLQVDDSTRIELLLMDECDEYPLEGREIILEPYTDAERGGVVCHGPTNGTVSPTRVTTDGEGKAWVTFYSGSDPGMARVSAVHCAKKPYGSPFAIVGSTSFNLPSNMWDVAVKWYQDTYSKSDVTSSEGGPTVRNTAYGSFHAEGAFGFTYENKDPENQGEDTLVVSAPDDTTAGVVHDMLFMGLSQDMSITRLETLDEEGTVIGFYYANSGASGVTGDESSPGLYFEKRGSSGFFQLGGSQHRTGSYHIKMSGVPDPGSQDVDEWNSIAMIFFSSFSPGAVFSSSNNNFEVKYEWTDVQSEEGHLLMNQIKLEAKFTNQNPPTGVNNSPSHELPRKIFLYQNYPNPFNPTTTISFEVPQKSFVSLRVYDILGREVMTLLNERKERGKYDVRFDGSRLSTGPYFYRLQAGDYTETKKLMLVR